MKVRDIIAILERDGWRFHSQRGSPRQFVHTVKPGRVTVPCKPATKVMKYYAIVIEKASGNNYSAFAVDVPLCFSTGATVEEVKRT